MKHRYHRYLLYIFFLNLAHICRDGAPRVLSVRGAKWISPRAQAWCHLSLLELPMAMEQWDPTWEFYGRLLVNVNDMYIYILYMYINMMNYNYDDI
jgi:hypothetical protein